VPKAWFKNAKGDYENFETQITIATNKWQKQFGFINFNKRMYIAYEKKEYESGTEMGRTIIPELAEASYARN